MVPFDIKVIACADSGTHGYRYVTHLHEVVHVLHPRPDFDWARSSE